MGSGLYASAGGKSTSCTKPSWQTAPGVPADGKRDVPDVAMAAAGHDAYLIQIQGSPALCRGHIGGHSFPGERDGPGAPGQYRSPRGTSIRPSIHWPASSLPTAGRPFPRHHLRQQQRARPHGLQRGHGYDQVTGLGSVDAQLLVNHWQDASTSANFELNAGKTSLAVAAGPMARSRLP